MSSFLLKTGLDEYTEEEIISGKPGESVAPELCRQWLSGQTSFAVHTSGSTGTPKNIVLSRAQILASALRSLEFFQLTPGSKVLCPLSLEVIGGKMMLLRSLIGQLQIECIPADRELRYMRPEQVYDFMPVSPLQLHHVLLNHPEKISSLNSIRQILIGGGIISDELMSLIRKHLTTTVWQSYGMTETVSHIALRRIHPVTEEAYTVLSGIQIDTDGRGCLKIKGDITDNQWIQTNDLVQIHTGNSFSFQGRNDLVINSGGIKIQIEKLEQIIAEVFTEQQVHRAFFIAGQKDAAYGEKVILFAEGETMEEEALKTLTEAIKKRVPKFHAPQQIFFGTFQYTASGKTDRLKTQADLIKKE